MIGWLPESLHDLFGGGSWEPAEGVPHGDLDERDEEAVRILIELFDAPKEGRRDKDGYITLTRPQSPGAPDRHLGDISATVGWLGRGTTKVWAANWPNLRAGVYALAELRKLAGIPGRTFTIKDAPSRLPDGYRLWEEGDDAVPDPVLGRAAYIGPVGAYLDVLAGQTEAHPAAVGLQCLAMLGTIIGRRACYRAGRIVHHANLFGAVVGPPSEGAKGVADAEALGLISRLKPRFLSEHSIGGLGSGEALIRELADGQDPPTERRRIVIDAELSAVFKVARRPDSILSDVLRKAYDYGPLRHSTVTGGWVTATGHHIAIVGSITPAELCALVDDLAIANGFASRFLYAWSRISAWLPDGGDIDDVAVAAISDRLEAAIGQLDHRLKVNGSVRFGLNRDAHERWRAFYRERRVGVGVGISRALSARHVAHAARLMLIYAVIDGADLIDLAHVEAAIAWCDYSRDSAAKVFGASLGGKADLLLAAVRDAMPDGIYGTTLHDTLAHHWRAGELVDARALLEARHLLHVISEGGEKGRPRDRYVALTFVSGAKT